MEDTTDIILGAKKFAHENSNHENFDCDDVGEKITKQQDQLIIGINKWNEIEKDKQKFRVQKECENLK